MNFARTLAILFLSIVPVLAFADSKSGTLALEIENELRGVTPNSVYVVVDETTKTAYVRGAVSSQAEVDRIINMLRSIDGVRVIGSTVTVKSSPIYGTEVERSVVLDAPEDFNEVPVRVYTEEPVPVELYTTISRQDAHLEEAIQEALDSEGITGQSKIKVDSENSHVTLTGASLSEAMADRLVTVAMSVPGVRKVQPNIVLLDGRSYEVKPNFERDKDGHQIGCALSRVEQPEGVVEIEVDLSEIDYDDR
jgi:hypothetical protein